jgi:hypothetical protein
MDGKSWRVAAVLLLASVVWPAGSLGGVREKVVLVFCDITSSLDLSERNAVADLTANIILNLEPPVRYEVLPIMLETERAKPIISERVPVLVKPSDKLQYRKALEALPAYLNKEISALYERANGPGTDPDRSCIINALERASGIFDQYRSQGAYELHMIIVSDMLEECKQSPYGVPIRLNRVDIQKEIELAKKPAKLGNLAGVRVALVVPSGGIYSSKYVRPPLRNLADFWRTIFRHSGLPPQQLNNPDTFYFGPGLPERLRRPW